LQYAGDAHTAHHSTPDAEKSEAKEASPPEEEHTEDEHGQELATEDVHDHKKDHDPEEGTKCLKV
jgi:hypothetical protein